MPQITIIRTDAAMLAEDQKSVVRQFLFGLFKGATDKDDKRWNRFWRMAVSKEAGEMFDVETCFPRYTPYHKRHMKIEQDVFNAQDRFKDFSQFRNWLKIGAGFVDWVVGPKGGIVPLPRSIEYSKLEEQEFREFHDNLIDFLRGEHAAPYLWRHLGEKSHDMMDSILREFRE